MSLLKAGRPIGKKEKAIASIKDSEESIRININIPKDFHKQLKQKALDEDTTIKDIVIRALNAYMSK